jgi:hypothetical protein
VLWGLFFYWLLAMFLRWTKEKKLSSLLRPSAFFWLSVVLGLGAAFMQLFPSFMFMREAFSVRGVERGFEYAASWSLHWPEFFSLWVPQFGSFLDNYWGPNPFKLNTEYAGAMALLFAVVAVVYRPRPWRIFWAAVALFAVLFSLGANTPVFKIAYYIVPGVKKFRAASMFMFWFSFATVMLSTLFFADVMRDRLAAMAELARKRWQRGLLIAIGVITLLALIFSSKGFVSSLMASSLDDMRKSQVFEQNFARNFVPMLWLWWFYAALSLGLLWALVQGKVSKYLFLGVVLVIGLIDTMNIDSKFISVVNPTRYFYDEPAVVQLQQQMPRDPFRLFPLPGTFATQNAAGIHGLEEVEGFHDNELLWYRAFRGEQSASNFFQGMISYDPSGKPYLVPDNLQKGNNFLDLANARYVVGRNQTGLVVIENRNALGRLSFVPGYRVMKEDQIVPALQANAYDIRSTVALLEEPAQKPSAAAPADSTAIVSMKVEWKKYTPNYREAQVSAPREGFLRFAEVYYPGWKIRVDGKPVKYYRADQTWMAIYLAQGSHRIEMMPTSLYLGKAELVSFPIIAVLILYWIAMAVVSTRKKRGI